MWGRYFRNAELEKMVEQDLSRLYPEHGSYFQTPGCQGILRRILLHWCLRYPGYGYRQGMHELLAPLLFVLHSDVQRASEVRNHYEDYFTDKFDDAFFHENDISHDYYDFTRTPDSMHDAAGFRGKTKKVVVSLEELDPSIQTIVSLSDAYGAEGELGIMLSEKFLEHDAYCMFDALLSGAGGAVAMAEFFSHLPAAASQTGLPPVIEASSVLYHMLSVVDSSLHSHLVELGVEPQYFALRWFRILFGREFSLEHLLLIWDEIFSLDNSPCPSSDSDQAAENEPGAGSFHGVLNSPRGAFISAMAVSMILSVRSSLLATENATSCLQRLLNFPESVDLMKLLEKAKSLLPVALDANRNPIPYYPLNLPYSENRSKTARVGHSLSFDSSSPKTPTSSLAERYWEEKWRVVLHKEEELRKDHYTKKQASTTTTTTTPKKSWTEKVRSRLSRTESDPSSSKRANRGKRDHKSSVRRSLLDDLAQKLQLEEDHTGLTEAPESVTFKDPLLAESSVSGKDVQEIIPLYTEKKNRNLGCQRTATGSEENAAEADPESSSLVESPLPISDPPDAYNMSPSGFDSSCESSLAVAAGPSSMNSEERNSLSGGKFDWLWKFAPLQASVERRSESDRGATTTDEGTSSAAAAVSHENNKPPVNMKGNDQNLICSLRSVGQVMLENIQVIETVFQQDRGGGGGGGVGSLDNLSKKNNLVERGQVAALTALKELQKIGNLLSEM